MAKLSPYYVLISTEDFSVHLATTKTQVAAIAKCHINTLLKLSDRTTVNNYIIIPVTIERSRRR